MAVQIDPTTTALILIDLQYGILALPVQPHSPQSVLENGKRLAASFRSKHAKVVYVRVDLSEMQTIMADVSHGDPSAPPPPPEASEISAEAGYEQGDLLVTKHHWSAFGQTDLEQKLRQDGIKTIVLGGLVTNFGVESTARQAVAQGFDVVFVEDACSAIDPNAQQFAFTNIFPLLGRVRTTKEVVDGLQ